MKRRNEVVMFAWHIPGTEYSFSLIEYSQLVAVVSFWVLKTRSVLVRPAGERLSRAPAAPPRPRDRIAPAAYSIPRFPRRKKRRHSLTRRVGIIERCLPGDGLLALGGSPAGILREEEGVSTFLEAFPPGDVFMSAVLGFHLYGKHFFPKMEHYHLPQDIFNVPATSCCESVCTAVVAVGIRTRFLR